MSRIVLVHWNAAECEARAASLRRAGHDVVCHADSKANPRALAADPPDVFVIDLARLPSQGRKLGGFLRRTVGTRLVPLVYVEGDPGKTESVRALLPDAIYTTWSSIGAALRRATTTSRGTPVVPGAMDAYARAPLSRELGIRTSCTLVLLDAPPRFKQTLGTLPDSVRVTGDAADSGDVVVGFATDSEALDSSYDRAAACVQRGGRLWILWRKRRGHAAGLTQSDVREAGLRRGWVDYKVCSVDNEWSGLCFARRPAADSPSGVQGT